MVVEASVGYMTNGHCPEWRLMFFLLLVLLVIENIVLWDTESQEKIDRMVGLRFGEE
jgi:hypothetical protein